MEFLIIGTITFLRRAKIKMIKRRKKPATQKKPAAGLFSKPPNHQAKPVKAKIKKKKVNKKVCKGSVSCQLIESNNNPVELYFFTN